MFFINDERCHIRVTYVGVLPDLLHVAMLPSVSRLPTAAPYKAVQEQL